MNRVRCRQAGLCLSTSYPFKPFCWPFSSRLCCAMWKKAARAGASHLIKQQLQGGRSALPVVPLAFGGLFGFTLGGFVVSEYYEDLLKSKKKGGHHDAPPKWKTFFKSKATPHSAGAGGLATLPPAAAELVPGAFPLQSYVRVSDHYVSAFNPATRTPSFVIEKLTPSNCRGDVERQNFQFKEDPSLPAHLRVKSSDYTLSGYDRGHLAPAANHRNTPEAMGDTFYMTNISPQVASFNRGYWARLEMMLRELCKSYEEVYVITGVLQAPEWVPGQSTAAVAAAASGGPNTSNGSSSSSSAGTGASESPVSHGLQGRWRFSHGAIGDPFHWVHVPSHWYKVVYAKKPRNKSSKLQEGEGAPAAVPAAGAAGAVVPAGQTLEQSIAEAFTTGNKSGSNGKGQASQTPAAAASPTASDSEVIAAFVLPNFQVGEDRPITDFLVPIAALEKAAGLQFLEGAVAAEERLLAEQEMQLAAISEGINGTGAAAAKGRKKSSSGSRACIADLNGNAARIFLQKYPGDLPADVAVPAVLLQQQGSGSGAGAVGAAGRGAGHKRVMHLCLLHSAHCTLPSPDFFQEGLAKKNAAAASAAAGTGPAAPPSSPHRESPATRVIALNAQQAAATVQPA